MVKKQTCFSQRQTRFGAKQTHIAKKPVRFVRKQTNTAEKQTRFSLIPSCERRNALGARRRALLSFSGKKLPQHEWQNPAVAVVVHLDRRINAQPQRHGLRLAT